MRVCFLINQVAPGGAPTLLLDIVRNTNDADISYTLCVIEGDRALVDNFEAAGVPVVDFDASVKFDPRALWRMAQFFQENEFDIIHTHLPYSQTLGRIFGRLGGCRNIISTQHNVPDNYHPLTRILEQVTRGFDIRTIAVSEGVEQAFTGDSARYTPGQDRQWCTIYNGIDVESMRTSVKSTNPDGVREQWGVDANLVYLNVSRYVPAKSQTDLVQAMEQVVEEDQDTHLIIVGWGDKEAQIREAVDELELNGHVTVTGRVPTVEEYYALADVFVSSSTFEGMPIAHLEAMAAGLPIVATDIPGVREVVAEGKTGLLVPPEDPQAIAEAMLEMRSSERRDQFAKAGYNRVSTEFSIEQTVTSHLQLYREVVSG